GEPAADRAPEELERDLEVVGLVGIVDPVRQGAETVVATFRRAGIRLALVTGDHPVTAGVIAGRLGIDNRRVMTGDDLARATPEQLALTSVFARTRPEQKLDLVRGWQEEGEVVAMTGDGVNDAPALRRADIGVAMGEGGTEVARQAADLILLDDNLATVGSAVEEGRRIYANIRRFLAYALSGGVAEVLIMLVGPFLGYAVPLLPSQILWVNLLTHGVPGVAMGAEPAEADAMRRPPRSPRESVLGGGLWRQVVLTGLVIAVVSALAAWWVAGSGGPWQSTVFVVLGLSQLGVALAVRSRTRRASGIRFLSLAVAAAAILQVLPLYVPVLRTLIRVEALTPAQLAGATAFAVVPGLVVAVVRRLRGRSTDHEREPS
ncbi:MAG TPA: HAD-IC family P-type ATPase, partial [Actinopolymorphaceae bacterium]